MLRFAAPLLVALCLLLPPAAWADQTDKRLDELFARLQTTETSEEATRIEQAIWAIWLDSGSATTDLLMEHALAVMAAQDYPEALRLLDAVVELDPDYAEGWNKRATIYYLMGKPAKSLADVEHTLALEPRHFGALSGMGEIFLELGDDAKALDAFQRALEVDPHLAGAKAQVKRLERKVKGDQI